MLYGFCIIMFYFENEIVKKYKSISRCKRNSENDRDANRKRMNGRCCYFQQNTWHMAHGSVIRVCVSMQSNRIGNQTINETYLNVSLCHCLIHWNWLFTCCKYSMDFYFTYKMHFEFKCVCVCVNV